MPFDSASGIPLGEMVHGEKFDDKRKSVWATETLLLISEPLASTLENKVGCVGHAVGFFDLSWTSFGGRMR